MIWLCVLMFCIITLFSVLSDKNHGFLSKEGSGVCRVMIDILPKMYGHFRVLADFPHISGLSVY